MLTAHRRFANPRHSGTLDLTVQYQWNEKVQLFADFLNVFDIKPKFDPAAAYGLYGFNPAWAGPNIMGRYFRLGVRLDFE